MSQEYPGYWANCTILEPSLRKEGELVEVERNVYCGKATTEEEAAKAVLEAHGERLVTINSFSKPK
jgi:hypothetical protein